MRTKRVVILLAVGLSIAGLGFAHLSRAPEMRASSLPFYDSRDFTPRWSPVDHRIGPFHLVDQSNARFTERDLDGRIHVASFLFAQCPSLCPTLVERLKPVQKALSSRAGVMMVSYTVAPMTDTPSVLNQFGRLRGIDSAIWRLATGELSEIKSVLHDSYFADDTRPLEGEELSKLLHTEKVLLVDGQRRIRGTYNGTSAFEMERLVEDIDALKMESRGPKS